MKTLSIYNIKLQVVMAEDLNRLPQEKSTNKNISAASVLMMCTMWRKRFIYL